MFHQLSIFYSVERKNGFCSFSVIKIIFEEVTVVVNSYLLTYLLIYSMEQGPS